MALAVLAGYWPTLRAGFIYDDRFFVVENRSVHSLANTPQFFSSPSTTTASIPWNRIWRPLRNVSYALDHALWGLRPIGYHLTNLIIHLTNGLLLLAIAVRLMPKGPAPLMVGLVFAIHPIQSEAVAWVSGRDDLMVALFLLASWLARLRYRQSGRKVWLAGGLALFILSMLSKESAAAFPLVLPFLDILLHRRDRGEKRPLPWSEYTIWVVVAAAYFCIRLAILGGLSHRGYWGGRLLSTIATMLWVHLQYLRLIILPLWLRVDYIVPPVSSFGDWRWMAGLSALAVVTGLVWRFRRYGWLPAAWIWWLVMLLPVSNIIPIAAIMAERFLYLPMVGVSLLAGWFFGGLSPKFRVGLASVVLLLMAVLTMKRALEWREPGIFWSTEVSRSPWSPIAHNNLGQHYYRQGDLARAERCFSKALEIHPGLASARASLGDVYYHSGRYRLAVEQYNEYLRLEPNAYNRGQAEQRIQKINIFLASHPDQR